MRDAKQEHREDEGMLIIILYEYVYYHMLSSHTIIAVHFSSDLLSAATLFGHIMQSYSCMQQAF